MGPQEKLPPRTDQYVKAYSPFNKTEHYHVFCLITNYDDQGNVEYCSIGSADDPLPGMLKIQHINIYFLKFVSFIIST